MCVCVLGTIVRTGGGGGEEGSDVFKKMSEAFDLLEEDLMARGEGERGGGGRRRELVRMSLPANLTDR